MESLAIDIESTGLQIRHGCRAFMLSAADDIGRQWAWEFEVDPFTREVWYDKDILEDCFNVINSCDTWVFHNGLFDLLGMSFLLLDKDQSSKHLPKDRLAWSDLYKTKTIHDTMLMCHVENSLLSNALKPCSFYYLNYPEDDEKELDNAVKKSRTLANRLGWATAEPTHPHLTALDKNKHKSDMWLPSHLAFHHPSIVPKDYANICERYALGDAERTIRLYYYFKSTFTTNQMKAYEKNLRCLMPTYRMTDRGFQLKGDQVPSTLKELKRVRENVTVSLLSKVEKTDFTPPPQKSKPKVVGFNPNSGPHLVELLYKELKLPCPKMTKSGNPSTDKATLELLQEHPKYKSNDLAFGVIKDVLSLRKINATERYLKNYKIYQVDNKLYPSLNPTGTKTVRYSASNPNTQNISVQEAKGYEHLGISFSLRHMFGPPPGHIWACIDYSQLQLRIFAYACGDQQLIRSFEQGFDIHDTVARRIFQIAPNKEPTKKQRTAAKGVNFGIIFGAGKNKIELMTGMPGIYDEFREQFPLVEDFIRAKEQEAKQHRYCQTMGGYPLHVQMATAYKACNYVVQGTEGEMVKEAIYKTDEYCEQPSILFYPVMTIHDEIIFQSKMPMTLVEATHLKARSQLNTLQKLMNDSALEVGVVTEVDMKLTDDKWSTAA
jgi:DNA polymerase I-like protein with 3'-5' exonuclease and polymerase domains